MVAAAIDKEREMITTLPIICKTSFVYCCAKSIVPPRNRFISAEMCKSRNTFYHTPQSSWTVSFFSYTFAHLVTTRFGPLPMRGYACITNYYVTRDGFDVDLFVLCLIDWLYNWPSIWYIRSMVNDPPRSIPRQKSWDHFLYARRRVYVQSEI